MKHIYERGFVYKRSEATDVRATFERIRREQQQARTETQKVVSAIKPKVRAKT